MTQSRNLLFLFFILVLFHGRTLAGKSLVVELASGSIVGSTEISAKGRQYFAYRSVPFGSFIEGEHRFKVK